jgi:hypothetical protein
MRRSRHGTNREEHACSVETRRHHRKFVNCPIRNAYHPDWTPDWAALTDKHRHAEAYAMQTTPNNPHKYPHMGGEQGQNQGKRKGQGP